MATPHSQLSTRWGAIDMSRCRPLTEGDVFRKVDGSHHYVSYVNSSGAYIIPLSSQVRVINGEVVNFQSGGHTISANAVVQILHPLELGGNSQEYQNYVKLESKKGRGSGMARKKSTGKGTTLGEFEDAPLTETELAANEAEGTTAETETTKEKSMAKKAAAKKAAAPAAKRDKTPKTVRKCACACGGETTGHFCPGHDARMHGWIKKLAAGTIGPNEIPKAVAKSLDLVQTKEGYKAKSPHFWKQD